MEVRRDVGDKDDHIQGNRTTPTASSSTDLLGWLREKIAEAEKTLRLRENMEKAYLSGSDELWKRAASLHPSTKGKAMTKHDRMVQAEINRRIAAQCRHELEMCTAVMDALTHPNDTGERTLPAGEKL